MEDLKSAKMVNKELEDVVAGYKSAILRDMKDNNYVHLETTIVDLKPRPPASTSPTETCSLPC